MKNWCDAESKIWLICSNVRGSIHNSADFWDTFELRKLTTEPIDETTWQSIMSALNNVWENIDE